MYAAIDTFDQIYAISDVHLGGPPGRQPFRHAVRLAHFIDEIGSGGHGRVALVLAGNIIDFVADGVPGRYLDAAGAARRVRALMAGVVAKPVFAALGRFVRQRARAHLIWLAGAHDVELALPEVQHQLQHSLCEGHATAAARIRFITDGTGYHCRVGQERIYLDHGSQFDDWNRVDYESVRRVVQQRRMGITASRYRPSLGCRVQVDILSDLGRSHGCIDLFRPVSGAALAAVLALEPRALADVAALAKEHLPTLQPRLGEGDTLGAVGSMAKWGDDEAVVQLLASDRLTGGAGGPSPEALSERREVQRDELARELLARADKRYRSGLDYTSRFRDMGDPQSGGLLNALPTQSGLEWRDGGPVAIERRELLRLVQRYLADLCNLDPDRGDAFDRRVDRSVGAGVDIVIVGHSHQARAQTRAPRRDRRRGLGAYFNTGTWMSYLNIAGATPNVEGDGDEEYFDSAYEQLSHRPIVDLDAADLLSDRTTAVRITREGDRVFGQLIEVLDSDTASGIVLSILREINPRTPARSTDEADDAHAGTEGGDSESTEGGPKGGPKRGPNYG